MDMASDENLSAARATPTQQTRPPWPSQVSQTVLASQPRSFMLFPKLPVEVRAHIWKAAMSSRIVRWTRTGGTHSSNIFTVKSKSLPLFHVCRESRHVTLLYGQYKLLPTTPKPIWFSPLVDYLFFDPEWTKIRLSQQALASAQAPKDPFVFLGLDLDLIQNIMVHPNWTDHRKRPGILIERLSKLKQLLVVADERSIGVQSKYLEATTYDVKKYFEAVQRRKPEFKIPDVAVGCLGWTGAERGKIHHVAEDSRELVAVVNGHDEMKEHSRLVREEEMRFIRERFKSKTPLIALNFRPGPKWEEAEHKSLAEDSIQPPPPYSQIHLTRTLSADEMEDEVHDSNRARFSNWFKRTVLKR